MKFTSLEHITTYLMQQDKLREDHYTLDRMHTALDRLGRPDHAYTIVHVGGTSGKGSTSHIIAAILQAAVANKKGKVGVFTSPAIVSPLERLKVNGKQITEKQFVQLVNTVWPKLEDITLTYFEFFTLFALYYFSEQQVQYAVVEVGMGGRLDATNAADTTVAVVTIIGLDHTAILGNTKPAIAREKEQIIKGDTIGITGSTYVKRGRYVDTSTAEIISQSLSGSVFNYRSSKRRYTKLQLSIPASYQVHNAVLAIEVAEALGIAKQHIVSGLQRVKNPARFEVLSKRPLIIVDGAHNPQKMQAFTTSLQAVVDVASYERVVLLTALKFDKDIIGTYSYILPFTTHLIITTIGEKSHQLRVLQEQAKKINPQLKVWLRADTTKAHALFTQQLTSTSLGLITGSLYMIGDLRAEGLL